MRHARRYLIVLFKSLEVFRSKTALCSPKFLNILEIALRTFISRLPSHNLQYHIFLYV